MSRSASHKDGNPSKRPRTEPSQAREEWNCPGSLMSKRFVNPIRKLVDTLVIKPNPDKEMIPLSIGDPSVFGNFQPDDLVRKALVDSVMATKNDGYAKSTGYPKAREAIAKMYTTEHAPLTADDIVIASGCSGALDLAIGAIANEGDNILVPAPGFSLYKTLASAKGIETRSYKCLPENDWEADLVQMKQLIDHNTRAIIVTNPSNPCGSNFSRDHVMKILKVASDCKVPIIADEIYADMVYDGVHTSIASIKTDVPILTCGGLAKRWLVPGWRLGWVCIQDRNNVFKGEVSTALVNLSQLLLGACTLVQAALPAILANTPARFYSETLSKLKIAGDMCYEALAVIPGLHPVRAAGAMYLMCEIKIDEFKDIENEQDFVEKLISEQSVFPLPAGVFEAPNYFRIVITVPEEKITEAMNRIKEFCATHHK